MSLAKIKKKAVELSQTKRGELMSFSRAIQTADAEELRIDLTVKINAFTNQWPPLYDLQKHGNDWAKNS